MQPFMKVGHPALGAALGLGAGILVEALTFNAGIAIIAGVFVFGVLYLWPVWFTRRR